MSDTSEIYQADPPPKDTIVVIPRTLEYVYDQDNHGGDVIGILFDDKRVGPMMLTLTPIMATHIAAHLTTMVDDLDTIRAEYDERNTK